MKQLCLKDERGQLIAFIGNSEEFGEQHDAAKILGKTGEQRLAWIDWVESKNPGNGTSLMREALVALEAEGVRLIGLEVYARAQDFDRIAKFYRKFGFAFLAASEEHLPDGARVSVMLREADWNGMEP